MPVQGNEIVTVSTDLLEVDHTYQPPLSVARVKDIVSRFKDSWFQALTVNQREDGRWFVIDGQHRMQAARNLEKPIVRAWVFYGLSPQEEADMFFALNTYRRRGLTSVSAYVARLAAQNDPMITGIQEVLDKYELTVGKTNGGGSRIGSPVSLYFIWSNYGPERLADSIEIMNDAFYDDHQRWINPLLVSVAGFSETYPGIDRERLVTRLQESLARSWINFILATHKSNNQGIKLRWGGREERPHEAQQLNTGIAILRNAYNKGLRSGRI